MRALDALASDTRSLLRRAGKVQRRAADLGDPQVTEQGGELLDAAARLLDSLERRRTAERQLARQLVRGQSDDGEQP